MNSMVFSEENQHYQFDFTSAVNATDELHDIYQNSGANILSDVDFIVETDKEIILVEYKNANISDASHPEMFKPTSERLKLKMAYKYYDSWIYLQAKSIKKPVRYVYILEYPHGDSTSRKAIRNDIAKLLPFALQKRICANGKMISGFEVLSISEWNAHDTYKAFQITAVKR